jgi:hypothetical protein
VLHVHYINKLKIKKKIDLKIFLIIFLVFYLIYVFNITYLNIITCSLNKYKDIIKNYLGLLPIVWGHAVVQWLRHCATYRKVVGSITNCVGTRCGAVVEALRYKQEGRGIDYQLCGDTRWCSG